MIRACSLIGRVDGVAGPRAVLVGIEVPLYKVRGPLRLPRLHLDVAVRVSSATLHHRDVPDLRVLGPAPSQDVPLCEQPRAVVLGRHDAGLGFGQVLRPLHCDPDIQSALALRLGEGEVHDSVGYPLTEALSFTFALGFPASGDLAVELRA